MDALDEKAGAARGFSVVFDACAALFLNEPTDQVLSDIRQVACALGAGGFDGPEADAADSTLKQRYYDRLFVTSSRCYVPLIESCIARGGMDESGAMRYASVESSRGDHALRCYETVGFDYRALAGYPLAVSSLRPDSLAAELAFLAFCTRREAESWEAGDADQAAHWNRLARQFACEHVQPWIGSAAACLAATEDDVYARACRLAHDATEALQD